MFGGRRRLRVALFAAIALGSVGLGVLAYATGAFRSLELDTVDTRFSVRGERKPPRELVVVGIDTKTFGVLGADSWPYTHDVHAKLVDRLRRARVKIIAMDLQFSEPSDTDEQTVAFLEAMRRSGNIVASTTQVDYLANGNAFTYVVPDSVLKSSARGAINRHLRSVWRLQLAHGGFPGDRGGVVRRVTYDTEGLKSFSVAVAERAQGRPASRSTLGDGSGWIDYFGPPGTIREIPYADVLTGEARPSEFRDKIVVVGATDPMIGDLHPTSTSGSAEMTGPEIQAHAIGTVLSDFPLQESSGALNVALIVLLGAAVPAASLRLSALGSVVVAVVIAALYPVITQLAFNEGTILPFVYPIVALVLSGVAALAVHYVTEAFERRRIRETFARFIPDAVVGQVLEQAEGQRLGGVGREATVMFSDLRGFTSFAETLEPPQVIAILNRYLTAMVDEAILLNGGTLVDYMGDGIMAVFGAPLRMDDHADRALATARAKLHELARFNDWLHTEMGVEKSFVMGIGLNTGWVMSGNVGSEQRLAYTVIGDTTNTAARLEAMTKGTQHTLFLSDATRARLGAKPEDLVPVGDFEIRGREETVKVWSLAQAAGEAQPRERFESAPWEALNPARRR